MIRRKKRNVLFYILILLLVTSCNNSSISNTSEQSSTYSKDYDAIDKTIILDNDDFIGTNSSTVDGVLFNYNGCKVNENEELIISGGGYLLNDFSTPLTNLEIIKVEYDRISPYGTLKIKTGDFEITDYNIKGESIISNQDILINGTNSTDTFFSIYATNGEFNVSRITIHYSIQDYVKASNDFTLDIIGFNDFHGATLNENGQAGINKITTFVNDKITDQGIIVSSGDMWQGTADSNLTRGKLVTEWMNEVGFDAMALGNHEFDWTPEYIEKNSTIANFPLLGINVRDGEGKIPSYLKSSTIVVRNEIKIGIVGAIGNSVKDSISKDSIQDMDFELQDGLVYNEAKYLKEEAGCRFVIYLLHEDSSCVSSSLSEYVDVVFEGHTHQEYSIKDSNGLIHLQNKGSGDSIDFLKLNYDSKKDKITINEYGNYDLSEYENCIDSKETKELYDYYEENIIKNLRDEELTEISNNFNTNNVGFEASRAMFEKYILKDSKIVLAVCSKPRRGINKGIVTYGDLYQALPFDNQITICTVSGSTLKNTIMRNYPFYYSTYDNEYFDILDNDKKYYIVTDTWNSDYSSNACTEISRFDDYPREVLAQWYRDNK